MPIFDIRIINRTPISDHPVEGTEKWDMKVVINYPQGGLIDEINCHATVSKNMEHFDPTQISNLILTGANKRAIVLQIKQFLALKNDLKR